jgi:hypothetical protein
MLLKLIYVEFLPFIILILKFKMKYMHVLINIYTFQVSTWIIVCGVLLCIGAVDTIGLPHSINLSIRPLRPDCSVPEGRSREILPDTVNIDIKSLIMDHDGY